LPKDHTKTSANPWYEVDQAVCLEDTPLLPQRVKSGSIPGFALLDLRSRNRARSAFHTVFSTPSLIYNEAFHYEKNMLINHINLLKKIENFV